MLYMRRDLSPALGLLKAEGDVYVLTDCEDLDPILSTGSASTC